MAFSVGSGSGFSRRGSRFRGDPGALSEINVVPLVDVVLVLLIIFMLTAHVMEFGLEVDVPKVKQVRETAEELPVITISKNGELMLADAPVNINQIGEAVRNRYPRSKGVYLRADKGAVWDPIAQVISALGEAKLEVKVVTQPEDEAERPGRRRR
jgi:biopolymer transport protein ExbD